MMSKYRPDDAQEALDDARKNLRAAVVGHKIIAAFSTGPKHDSDVTMVLDTGRTVRLHGYGECCAWGEIKLIEFLGTDNVVTAVQAATEHANERWTIYAEGIPTMHLGASAVEGTGYYGFGISVEVSDA